MGKVTEHMHWSPYWAVLYLLACLLLFFCVNLMILIELRLYKQKKAKREHQALLRLEATLAGLDSPCTACGHSIELHHFGTGPCVEDISVPWVATYKPCGCHGFI